MRTEQKGGLDTPCSRQRQTKTAEVFHTGVLGFVFVFFLETSSVCFAFCAEKALGGDGAMEPGAAKMKHMERAE